MASIGRTGDPDEELRYAEAAYDLLGLVEGRCADCGRECERTYEMRCDACLKAWQARREAIAKAMKPKRQRRKRVRQ